MPRGGPRPGAGRPVGSRSPSKTQRALVFRIKSILNEAPDRDLAMVLSDIASDIAVPFEVRLAAMRRLQGCLTSRWLLDLERQGVRLPQSTVSVRS